MSEPDLNERRPLLRMLSAVARAIEARDHHTADHQRRVAELARRIGSYMNLSEDDVDGLRLAATLHDIGKIAVPSAILTKPRRLNQHEFGLIKMHPEIGFGIMGNVSTSWPIADVLHQHHERLDGSGYPLGARDEDIIVEARIVAVADVFDAMASSRPYRISPGVSAAVEELETNRGQLYDSGVVEGCLAVLKDDCLGYG